MKKALFFLPPTTGGAERVTTTFARLLDKEKFETAFVIVGRRKGDVVHYIPDNSRIIFVPALTMADFVWQKFWLLLKREKPEYVFSSITPINCHVIHAAKKVGVKSIVRCNCAVERIVGRDLKSAQKYYPQANFVVAQTEQMQNELISTLHIPEEKVITLHNPIDKVLIKEKANENNPFDQKEGKKYVWVGRFNGIKKVDILVKAFAKVVAKETQAKLYLVGKKDDYNNYYKMILSMIKELGIEQNVVFTDFQTNPYMWIKNADCLVLTSQSEASPNVVFESLFLGTPVVVSACTPDLDKIITDGNGYIVQVGNVTETAEAMLKIDGKDRVALNREPVSSELINDLFSK